MALSLSHNPQPKYEHIKLHFFFPVWFLFSKFFSCCFGQEESFLFLFLVLIGWILSCLHHQQSCYFVQVLPLMRHSKISHRCCDTQTFSCVATVSATLKTAFSVWRAPLCYLPSWWPFLSTQAAVQMHALHVAITNLSSLLYITISFLLFDFCDLNCLKLTSFTSWSFNLEALQGLQGWLNQIYVFFNIG